MALETIFVAKNCVRVRAKFSLHRFFPRVVLYVRLTCGLSHLFLILFAAPSGREWGDVAAPTRRAFAVRLVLLRAIGNGLSIKIGNKERLEVGKRLTQPRCLVAVG